MQVKQLTGEIDKNGNLRIDIPTQLSAGKVNLVVVINPTYEEMPKKYDFSDLVGKFTWQGDAVNQQRELRDEW